MFDDADRQLADELLRRVRCEEFSGDRSRRAVRASVSGSAGPRAVRTSRTVAARRADGRTRPPRSRTPPRSAFVRGGASTTTILVTHHVEEIPRTTTHAALLRQGCLVSSGPIDAVLTDANVTRSFDLPISISTRNSAVASALTSAVSRYHRRSPYRRSCGSWAIDDPGRRVVRRRDVPARDTRAGRTSRRDRAYTPVGHAKTCVFGSTPRRGSIHRRRFATARRLLDLDTDPATIDTTLRSDPALRPLVRATPGIRLPGTADGFELLVRAILGQQVSVRAARTFAGRIAEASGTPLERPLGDVSPTCSRRQSNWRRAGSTRSASRPPERRRSDGSPNSSLGELVLSATADRQQATERLLAVAGMGRGRSRTSRCVPWAIPTRSRSATSACGWGCSSRVGGHTRRDARSRGTLAPMARLRRDASVEQPSRIAWLG